MSDSRFGTSAGISGSGAPAREGSDVVLRAGCETGTLTLPLLCLCLHSHASKILRSLLRVEGDFLFFWDWKCVLLSFSPATALSKPLSWAWSALVLVEDGLVTFSDTHTWSEMVGLWLRPWQVQTYPTWCLSQWPNWLSKFANTNSCKNVQNICRYSIWTGIIFHNSLA